MKKIIITILLILILLIIIIKFNEPKKDLLEGDTMDNKILIVVNNEELIIELIDNKATKELKNILANNDISIEVKDYGNFEKVGKLGFELPSEDKNITTNPGDLVLYNGNEISLFYNSNTWSYTYLGKVINKDSKELKNILNTEDVTLILKNINS